jgi:hypothetical protein
VRVIVEVWGRAYVLQLLQGKVTTTEDPEEFERAPVDPHSVGGGQFEHGAGADSFTSDVVAGKKFGFRPEHTISPVLEPSDLYVEPPDGR